MSVCKALPCQGVNVSSNTLWVCAQSKASRWLLPFGHENRTSAEIPARINVQKRTAVGWDKGFARQVQHHCAVFANAVKHYRIIRLSHNLALM